MLTAAAVALLAGLALQPIAIRMLRRRGVLDHPTARSSHATATVRGGGIVVVLALLLGAVVGGALKDGQAVLVLLATALCALVGLAEDVHGVRVVPRFGLLLLACVPLALVPETAPAVRVVLALAAVGFAVAVVNAVNFMDGINGISSAQGLVAGSAYAVLASTEGLDGLAVVAAATVAAALAFAPFNVPAAKVFLGDTGSYGLGGTLAGLAVVLLAEGVPPEAALAPLALYLADTGSTLARRVLSRTDWTLPHREHVYQKLTDRGLTHTQVSGLVMVLVICCSALGSVSLFRPEARVLADSAILSLLCVYLLLPRMIGVGPLPRDEPVPCRSPGK